MREEGWGMEVVRREEWRGECWAPLPMHETIGYKVIVFAKWEGDRMEMRGGKVGRL